MRALVNTPTLRHLTIRHNTPPHLSPLQAMQPQAFSKQLNSQLASGNGGASKLHAL